MGKILGKSSPVKRRPWAADSSAFKARITKEVLGLGGQSTKRKCNHTSCGADEVRSGLHRVLFYFDTRIGLGAQVYPAAAKRTASRMASFRTALPRISGHLRTRAGALCDFVSPRMVADQSVWISLQGWNNSSLSHQKGENRGEGWARRTFIRCSILFPIPKPPGPPKPDREPPRSFASFSRPLSSCAYETVSSRSQTHLRRHERIRRTSRN